MKKIGFFGGSFDPIHFGHLNLALEIMEKAHLDKVYFCPANFSPYKIDRLPKASSLHRLEMIKLAIEDIKNFDLLDWEIKKEGPSYTIDTLYKMKNEFPFDTEINLIIDQKLLPGFGGWKEVSEIFNIANILIGSREDFTEDQLPSCLKKISNKKIIVTSGFEISSTIIRRRLQSGSYCGFLMPSKVLDYIYKYGLY